MQNQSKRIYEKFLEQSKFSSRKEFDERFKVIVPENFNFAYDVMDILSDLRGDELAMLWLDENKSEKRISFSDMMKMSNKAANALLDLGISKGDKVMVALRRHYNFWVIMLALSKIGAIAVPTTHSLDEQELKYRLNTVKVKAIFCSDGGNMYEKVDAIQGDCPCLQHKISVSTQLNGWHNIDDLTKEASCELDRNKIGKIKNSDTMILLFTSGATGDAKIVMHDFTYPLAHIMTGVYWQDIKRGDLHYVQADTGWGKALWGSFYGQWMAECAILVYDFEELDPREMLDMIQKHKIVTFCAPSTAYKVMVRENLEKYDLSSLRHVTSTADPLNAKVAMLWRKKFGIEIYEGYGQSETSLICGAVKSLEKTRIGAIGLPAPGWRIEICDDDGLPLGAGVPGEICVRTDETGGGKPLGLFKGYYNDPERTAQVWVDNELYRTGDIAYKDDKDYIWYVGRSEDMIKASGYTFGPFEIENAMLGHPAVLDIAVTGIGDDITGNIVKASIELNKGFIQSDELTKELLDYTKNKVASYKVPRIIDYMSELPKTISGKIRRAPLR